MTRAGARLGVAGVLQAAGLYEIPQWTVYVAPPASLDQVDGPTLIVGPVQLPSFDFATSCADRGEITVTLLVSAADTDPDATWTELDDLADAVEVVLVKAGYAPLGEVGGTFETRFPSRALTVETEV